MKSSLVRLTTFSVCASVWFACGQICSSAQTSKGTAAHRPAASAAHRPATTARPVSACATVPTLSPKIPTVAAGAGCPKVLYTITSATTQLSPLLSPTLKEGLEKLNQSFSIAYIDTKVGTGALAAAKMYYTVNYTGYLTDGTTFDTSVGKEPITFPYGARRVIQGWDTGFEGMHVGGRRRLFVPYQLAYGEQGRPPVIPAKAELIFDVDLVSQSEQPPVPKTPPQPPTPPAGATGPTGATGAAPAGAPGAAPAPAPGAAPQAPGKPATPPVTSTTPSTPPSPTGSTTPKQ